MARQRYIYRPDSTGRFKAVPVAGRVGLCKDHDESEPFEKRMLRSYYDLERNLGSRFVPDWGFQTPRTIKEAWSK